MYFFRKDLAFRILFHFSMDNCLGDDGNKIRKQNNHEANHVNEDEYDVRALVHGSGLMGNYRKLKKTSKRNKKLFQREDFSSGKISSKFSRDTSMHYKGKSAKSQVW
jgi:hypothetical protein